MHNLKSIKTCERQKSRSANKTKAEQINQIANGQRRHQKANDEKVLNDIYIERANS